MAQVLFRNFPIVCNPVIYLIPVSQSGLGHDNQEELNKILIVEFSSMIGKFIQFFRNLSKNFIQFFFNIGS